MRNRERGRETINEFLVQKSLSSLLHQERKKERREKRERVIEINLFTPLISAKVFSPLRHNFHFLSFHSSLSHSLPSFQSFIRTCLSAINPFLSLGIIQLLVCVSLSFFLLSLSFFPSLFQVFIIIPGQELMSVREEKKSITNERIMRDGDRKKGIE